MCEKSGANYAIEIQAILKSAKFGRQFRKIAQCEFSQNKNQNYKNRLMTAIQYFQQNKMQLIQFIQFIVTISSLAQQQQQKILVIFQSQLILMCLSVQSNQLFVFFSPVEWRTRLSTRIFKSSTFVQRRLFFSVKNHRIEWL